MPFCDLFTWGAKSSTGQKSLCVYAGVDDKKVQTDIEGEDGRERESHFFSVPVALPQLHPLVRMCTENNNGRVKS